MNDIEENRYLNWWGQALTFQFQFWQTSLSKIRNSRAIKIHVTSMRKIKSDIASIDRYILNINILLIYLLLSLTINGSHMFTKLHGVICFKLEFVTFVLFSHGPPAHVFLYQLEGQSCSHTCYTWICLCSCSA